MTKTAQTIWWCEHCRASGLLALSGLDVYTAVYRLETAHNTHQLALVQSCLFSTARVRVTEHIERAAGRH